MEVRINCVQSFNKGMYVPTESTRLLRPAEIAAYEVWVQILRAAADAKGDALISGVGELSKLAGGYPMFWLDEKLTLESEDL